ncbi:MAG TPA: vitamin B12-dependent ribonucleotide reductase [Terriglobales bacterium]|nr:vitamin B12-dependent ribonucleotide reductase [Terriglobales bacterium]
MAEVSEKTTTAAAVSGKAAPVTPKKNAPGLTFRRLFTKAGISPYDVIEWERRTALITDASGKTIFEQKDVEVPKDWSMTATNIVASKYLHGQIGTPERETGVRQLVARVAETITAWGKQGGYFHSADDAQIFHDELAHLLLNQMMAFNSPVWFNVGCDRIEPDSDAANWHWNPQTQNVEFTHTGYKHPQCSACFINSVQDSMESIMSLARTEAMLFKWGSGTGSNLSSLRGSSEQLSGGGTASGPLSFMKGFDAFAGVIKSGGKTRRAAKMVILNIDHPDIEHFIDCKMIEERKAHALMAQGYDGSSPDSDAYSSIFFQNANNSVRVTDEFMAAVESDGTFSTHTVRNPEPVKTYRARDLMQRLSEATWHCGDPGMQYDTTINRWHTSKNTARINASNPCSEYMFLDDSACNLASLNLMKFAPSGTFDVEAYRHAVDVTITAQEIVVDFAGYPTESIMRNSHDYRPLGLGYANLGALLMAAGLPYDSDAGRDYAACVTAIMCGQAYLQSSRIAELCPPLAPSSDPVKTRLRVLDPAAMPGAACPGFYINREPFLDVIRMHRAEVNKIGTSLTTPAASSTARNQLPDLIEASRNTWDQALAHGERFGYRNSQVTVLAPTGTIGFMMDCDTTGIEPDLALVKYKKLSGGGMIKIVNNTVPAALFKLGYADEQCNAIVSYIDATGTIEGAPHIKDEHLAVFDCSFRPAKGTRAIHYMGHIKMMAATQPFISGAISKTVNLPESASVEDVSEAYMQSWKLGVKAVAIYRDGCKKSQPLSAAGSKTAESRKEDAGKSNETHVETGVLARSVEQRLPSAEVAALKPEGPIDAHASDAPPLARRHRLPDERRSLTHKFNVGGHEGYIVVGVYPGGQPGEIFITMAKEGSTVSGLMDSFATAISIALQHGVTLKLLCDKFKHTRFEPSGWSGNSNIGYASSIMDYIFRWLEAKFITGQQQFLFPEMKAMPTAEEIEGARQVIQAADSSNATSDTSPADPNQRRLSLVPENKVSENRTATEKTQKLETPIHAGTALREMVDMGDAPSCHVCGAIMVRNGSCFRCMSCGSTSGCS